MLPVRAAPDRHPRGCGLSAERDRRCRITYGRADFRYACPTVTPGVHMSAEQPTIIYTLTDEAPLLATYAFLPVIRTFADAAGIT